MGVRLGQGSFLGPSQDLSEIEALQLHPSGRAEPLAAERQGSTRA